MARRAVDHEDGGRRGVENVESTDEMASGAGEPSTKRAKVDEAKEEEDPLVRRKEEVVRLLEEASAKGSLYRTLQRSHQSSPPNTQSSPATPLLASSQPRN